MGGVRVVLGIFLLWSCHSFVWVGLAHSSLDILTSLSLREQYTDNLFFSNTNKREDYGTIINPVLTLAYQDKNIVLAGSYIGNAQFYVNNGGADTYSQNAGIFMDFPYLNRKFKRLTLRFIERISFSPSLPAFTFDDATLAGAGGVLLSGFGAGGFGGSGGQAFNQTGQIGAGNQVGAGGIGTTNFGSGGLGGVGGGINNQGVFTRRTSAFANVAGVVATYAWTPRLNHNVTYLNRIVKFTDNTNFIDGTSNSVRTRVSYSLTPRTSVNASYGLNVTGFPGSGFSTLVTHSITGGFSHILTQDISLFGNFGTGLSNSTSGILRASGGITKTSLLTNYSLRYTRFIGTGAGVAAGATLSENITAQIVHQLTAKLVGFVRGGYGKNKALSGTTVFNIDTYQGGAGLRYPFYQWLEGNIDYIYLNQRASGFPGLTAEVNQVFLTVTVLGPIFRLMN